MVFVNQTDLILNVDVGVDITGCTAVEVGFRKPSGLSGSVTAEVLSYAKGKIKYTVAKAAAGEKEFLDEAGTWRFWGRVTASDGRVSIGQPAKVVVYPEGETI